MQLGEIIRGFSEEAPANEALLACNDIVLVAQVGEAAGRFEETVGEYAAGAVRRFANLAVSEDWLALMNAIERADDPGLDCLTFECEGGGLRDLIASAIDRGIPVVIGVPERNLDAWRTFAGEFAVELLDRRGGVLRWLEGLL